MVFRQAHRLFVRHPRSAQRVWSTVLQALRYRPGFRFAPSGREREQAANQWCRRRCAAPGRTPAAVPSPPRTGSLPLVARLPDSACDREIAPPELLENIRLDPRSEEMHQAAHLLLSSEEEGQA